MIKINLLPKEIKKKKEKKKIGLLIALGSGIVVGSFMGLYFYRQFQLNKLESQCEEVDKELKRLQAIVKRIEEIEKAKKELELKFNVISELKKNRLIYPKLMENFLKAIPTVPRREIWLTSFITRSSPATVSVDIDCYAFNNYAITRFMRRLEETPMFKEVTLGPLRQSSIKTIKVINFKLSFVYQI